MYEDVANFSVCTLMDEEEKKVCNLKNVGEHLVNVYSKIFLVLFYLCILKMLNTNACGRHTNGINYNTTLILWSPHPVHFLHRMVGKA